jgi:hypothetical protein
MPILDKFSRQLPKARKLFRKEILILLGLFVFMLILRGGIEIRDSFVVDRALQFDNWALSIARQPDNPQYLRGPTGWMRPCATLPPSAVQRCSLWQSSSSSAT